MPLSLQVPSGLIFVLGVYGFCIVSVPQSKKYVIPMKFRNCLYRLWFFKCKYAVKSSFVTFVLRNNQLCELSHCKGGYFKLISLIGLSKTYDLLDFRRLKRVSLIDIYLGISSFLKLHSNYQVKSCLERLRNLK